MQLKVIDKLVLKTLLRPFLLSLSLIVFVLLMQTLLVNFEDIIGKGLGPITYLKLLFYISVSVMQYACPIAIMGSCILGFSKLANSNQVVTLQTSGISSFRIMLPGFLFALILTILLVISNGYLIPNYSRKSYALFYDLLRKKPALNIKEGAIYNGIPGYSIKLNQKLPDNKSVNGVMIYDHTSDKGNNNLTIADFGNIYTVMDDNYLVIELFDGVSYIEESELNIDKLYKTKFSKNKLLINLESLKLGKSSDTMFSNRNRFKNYNKLMASIKKIKGDLYALKERHVKEILSSLPEYKVSNVVLSAHINNVQLDDLIAKSTLIYPLLINKSLINANHIFYKIKNQINIQSRDYMSIVECYISINYKLSLAFNCLITFIITASLGLLSNRDKLFLTSLISSFLLLMYYIIENYAQNHIRKGMLNVFIGCWLSNLFLLPFAIYFLYKAQSNNPIDINLFSLSRYKK